MSGCTGLYSPSFILLNVMIHCSSACMRKKRELKSFLFGFWTFFNGLLQPFKKSIVPVSLRLAPGWQVQRLQNSKPELPLKHTWRMCWTVWPSSVFLEEKNRRVAILNSKHNNYRLSLMQYLHKLTLWCEWYDSWWPWVLGISGVVPVVLKIRKHTKIV